MKKEKIAVVAIRYGINVGGGAETLCRTYAETLLQKYEVDVITTKATNHVTWANEMTADEEEINGVKVKRFAVDFERALDDNFMSYLERLNKNPKDLKLGEEFMKIQGPYSTPMLEYLKAHKDEYKYVLYCPYLYAPAYFGLQITNKESNVLIPAAHDEPFLYYKVMGNEYKNVSKVIFLTEEEKELVHKTYPGTYETSVIGMGINTAPPTENFITTNPKIKNPYLIYVGRIEEGKGVDKLIEYFIRYKQNHKIDLDLVLVGKSIMQIPSRKDVIHLGYLSEGEKIDAIQNSEFLILSSQYESYSIVTLEALSVGSPVLVNGNCEVLKGHCLKSNAGLWYRNFHEFELAVNHLLSIDEETKKEMGENGRKYVESNYTEEIINEKLFEFLD